ncbi:hypothetical protein [Idiomarina abyssalis]|uniref:hypothetical protein n=1 Tax=Idiomarina abyssalis TaxID=86102 RepID=UPI003A9178BD
MGHVKSPNRYPDVQEYLNQAMDSERGIRIEVPSRQAGFSLRMKIYAKKKDWRHDYITLYENDPDNPDRHRDPFQLIQPDVVQDPETGKWYLYLRKDNPYAAGVILNIEPI